MNHCVMLSVFRAHTRTNRPKSILLVLIYHLFFSEQYYSEIKNIHLTTK